MRYFIDSEFIDDGKSIDLISLAMVCEDGREIYLQSVEFDANKANLFVGKYVLPQLSLCPHNQNGYMRGLYQHGHGQCTLFDGIERVGFKSDCPWRTRSQIARELVAFCDPGKYGNPEFWGYYADYDHVALCQLYGAMIDLPAGWPKYTMDIKQWCKHLGNPRLPEQDKDEHHALADARHNQVMWKFLDEYSRQGFQYFQQAVKL